MALKKPRERGAFFIFCPNTHELSCERLTPLAYNAKKTNDSKNFTNKKMSASKFLFRLVFMLADENLIF